MIKFAWDPAKALTNKKKHGVSFNEAQSVFYDEFAVQFFDEDNAESEDRFLMLGFSDQARLLSFVIVSVSKATSFALSQQEKRQKTRPNIIKERSHENRIRSFENEVAQKSLCVKIQEVCDDAAE